MSFRATGFSGQNNLNVALDDAIEKAKIGLQSELVDWKLAEISGKNGGFVGVKDLWVTIDANAPHSSPPTVSAQRWQMGLSGPEGGSFLAVPVYGWNTSLRLFVYKGSWVNGIRVQLDDLDVGVGKSGDTVVDFTMAPNEYFTELTGFYGGYGVDYVRLVTNRNRVAEGGGGGRSVGFRYTAPPGFAVASLLCRAGDWLNSIGVELVRHSH